MASNSDTITGLQHMYTNVKQSVYFDHHDLKAIQKEIDRQNIVDDDEARLREQITERCRVLELINQQYGLMERCPQLFEHFAEGLADLEDELAAIIHQREAQQRAQTKYD